MIARTAVPAVRLLSTRDGGVTAPPPPTVVLSGPDAAGGAGGVGPSVVVDFGTEIYGGVRLDVLAVDGGGSCRLRVRLGESVTEANAGTYVDREERVRAGSTPDFGVTGFRFARLDVVGPAAAAVVATPEAYCLARDLPALGTFRCDDDRLERVWEAGARTARLCAQELIWDGVKRGRTVWAGDLYPASAALAAAFGPHPVVAASLDHPRDRARNPSGPPDWMNGIPAYSLCRGPRGVSPRRSGSSRSGTAGGRTAPRRRTSRRRRGSP